MNAPPSLLCSGVAIPPGQTCVIQVVATTTTEDDDQRCLQGDVFPQLVVGYKTGVEQADRVNCGISITEDNWMNKFQLTIKVCLQ